MTTIASTTHPVSKIDFPSVTFCNFNHIVKRRHPPSQTEVLGRVRYSDSEWERIADKIHRTLYKSPAQKESSASNIALSPDEVYCTAKKAAQRCQDMVIYCLWSGTLDCSGLFRQVTTQDGFCCSTDLTHNLTLYDHPCPGEETQDLLKEPDFHLPNDGSAAGLDRGLTVVLDAQVDQYYLSTFHSVGFKIHLQEPWELPGLGNEGVAVSPGKEVFVTMRAQVTYTSSSALHLSPDQRRCYQTEEGSLEHYPGPYSQAACVLDHYTSLLLHTCGCRYYYMAGTAPICVSEAQITCGKVFEDNWHNDTVRLEHISEICLPLCDTTSYLTSLSYASMPTPFLEKTSLALKFLPSVIKVLCREGKFMQQKKMGDANTSHSKDLKNTTCDLRTADNLEERFRVDPYVRRLVHEYLE